MTKLERRRQERRAVVVPVSVRPTETPPFEGATINVSSGGALLTLEGNFPLLVEVKGHQYQGHLVRAYPTGDGRTAYAVELDEAICDLDSVEQAPETVSVGGEYV